MKLTQKMISSLLNFARKFAKSQRALNCDVEK